MTKRDLRDQSPIVVGCKYQVGVKKRVVGPTLEVSIRPRKKLMSYNNVESCIVLCFSCVESSYISSYINIVSYATTNDHRLFVVADLSLFFACL